MTRIIIASLLLTTASFAQDIAGNCLKITSTKMSGVSVSKAEMLASGGITFPGWGENKFETHCFVQGKINERIGTDGKPYAIGFELRMPVKWNGKFMFQGGGGSDGVLRPAVGITRGGSADVNALSKGYAVVSTDAGHLDEKGVPNGAYLFGLDEQAREDLGFNAVIQTTYVAKYLIANTYGKQPAKTYFNGCSNGGRQALKAVQTIPEEFDGIIAQAPAMRLSGAAPDNMRVTQLLAKFAPKRADGFPDLNAAFSQEELTLVSNAILDKCDAQDGVKDGMIYNTKACKFNATVLSCKAGQNSACLPHYKALAINEMYSGVWAKSKRVVYASFPWDTGISGPSFRFWRMGLPAMNLVPGSVSYYFTNPPTKSANLFEYALKADIEVERAKIFASTKEFKKSGAESSDSVAVNMDKFINKGGKIIMTHGMSDAIFSANDTISYYGQIKARYGVKKTDDSARLFLQPGMGHCSGGSSADEFDLLNSLDTWVNTGKSPESIMSKARAIPTVSYAGRTRPMCAYPKYAHYKGTGSIEDAANFECKL